MAGTRFQGKWQLNGPPRRGWLNVYLMGPQAQAAAARAELGRDVGRLVGTCAYVGSDDVIVCDTYFLDRFLQRRQLADQVLPFTEPGRDYLTPLFIWVLGHELGHLLNGHGAGHFSADGFETHVANSALNFRREYEADAFLATALARDKRVEYEVVLMLVDVLHAEISRHKFGRYLRSPYGSHNASIGLGGDAVVEYTNQGTHPEFIVRIARILQLVGDFPQGANEHLRRDVEEFLKRIRERAAEGGNSGAR